MNCEAFIKNVWLEVLPEVDDSVLELTATAWGIANATCQVVLCTHSSLVIAHVLSVTLDAKFKVLVAVELRHCEGVNSTLTVKAINVLADDTLENATTLKLNQCHVRRRRLRLLDSHVERHSIGGRKLLTRLPHILLVLVLECGLLPAAWSSFQDSAIA